MNLETLTIEARRFPVTVHNAMTGKTETKYIVLTKQQLQAAQIVGQSSKELICRQFAQKGFKVLDIGKPERKSLTLDLEVLWGVL